jgi:DNA-binding NtrC family response regulator
MCSMTARVIVTDQDGEARARIAEVLRTHGYEAQACADASETIAALGAHMADVVVADVSVGGTSNGSALAHEVALAHPELPVIVVTDVRTMTAAMPAMRGGAQDLLLKPFHDIDVVRAVDMAVRRSGKEVPGGRVHSSVAPPPPSVAPPPMDIPRHDMPSAAKMPLASTTPADVEGAPGKKSRKRKKA